MQTITPSWLWAIFAGTGLVSLCVDVVVPKKQNAHAIGVKDALNRSLNRTGLSFAFSGLPGVRSATAQPKT